MPASFRTSCNLDTNHAHDFQLHPRDILFRRVIGEIHPLTFDIAVSRLASEPEWHLATFYHERIDDPFTGIALYM